MTLACCSSVAFEANASEIRGPILLGEILLVLREIERCSSAATVAVATNLFGKITHLSRELRTALFSFPTRV